MNHCHDCNSSYSEPGTCNCFAFGGKRAPRYGWGGNGDVVLDNQTRTYTVCPDCGGRYEHPGAHICTRRLNSGRASIGIQYR